jgi:Ca2+-binding EF-hand superfamily protein
MARYRQQFETELKQKLSQKSSAHCGEETVLIRAFKYFDLDNSGMVSPDEWTKAIERIGVTSVDQEMIQQLFILYDVDRSGELDYKEFSAMLFEGVSPAGRSKAAAAAPVGYA